MITIGYEKALHYMRDNGYKAHVTMSGERLERFELIDAKGAGECINVQLDSAKRLIPLCDVTGSVNHQTAIMEFRKEERA